MRRWNKNKRVLKYSVLYSATIQVFYNGGQKGWDLSSDFSKTSDPSHPTLSKVEFWAPWVKMSAFFGHNIVRGSGGEGGGGVDDAMNPKPMKKLSLEAKCYVTITWKGFFTRSQVLLFPIEVNYRLMALKTYNKNWSGNLLLPPFGTVDEVLHNADTSKFSIRTCWPRVQSDPFWLRFLHIFRRYKKQFSKDKRPSGSNKIIRRQTIKNASSLSLPPLFNCTCTASWFPLSLFLGV